MTRKAEPVAFADGIFRIARTFDAPVEMVFRVQAGWTGSFEQLEAYLGGHSLLDVRAVGEREILMTRVFDAPRERVFEALTDAATLKRWLHGPEGNVLESCTSDARPGGRLRFEWRLRDGSLMCMHGEYREVDRPTRLVHTEEFEVDWTDGAALVTTALEELDDGRTLMRQTVGYRSGTTRDTVLESGMAYGAGVSYDRLDVLFEAGSR